jgi:hypothetical protein
MDNPDKLWAQHTERRQRQKNQNTTQKSQDGPHQKVGRIYILSRWRRRHYVIRFYHPPDHVNYMTSFLEILYYTNLSNPSHSYKTILQHHGFKWSATKSQAVSDLDPISYKHNHQHWWLLLVNTDVRTLKDERGEWVSYCYLTTTQQFFCYIMARTS